MFDGASAPSVVVQNAVLDRLRTRITGLFELASAVLFDVSGPEGIRATGPLFFEQRRVEGVVGSIDGPGQIAFPFDRSHVDSGTFSWHVEQVVIGGETLVLEEPVNVDLGTLRIPAISRDFPEPPTLVSRHWSGSEGPEPLDPALKWSTELEFETSTGVDDDTRIGITIDEATVPKSLESGTSLSAAIVRAQAMFRALEPNLASLSETARDTHSPVRTPAIWSLRFMIGELERIVQSVWDPETLATTADYRTHTTTSEGESRLILTGLNGATVERIDVMPLTEEGEPVPNSKPGEPTKTERTVSYPALPEQRQRQRRRLSLGPLRLPKEASVDYRLFTQRNRQLDGTDLDPRFRRSSNPVAFGSPILPALDASATTVDATSLLGNTGRTLESWLEAITALVLDGGARTVQLQARLEFPLAGNGPTQTLLRPVCLTLTLTTPTANAHVPAIATAIRAQVGQRNLGDGWLAIDMALYGVDASTRLSQFPRIRVPLASITDLLG